MRTVEPIAPAPDGNTQVVLTGFSGRGTRTGFGGAEDGAVPFLWSAGDYIWARNTRSEAIAEVGSQAISYTTGVPAMIGAMMMVTGKWMQPGVWNMEQLDPDPFMEQLNLRGLPWVVQE